MSDLYPGVIDPQPHIVQFQIIMKMVEITTHKPVLNGYFKMH